MKASILSLAVLVLSQATWADLRANYNCASPGAHASIMVEDTIGVPINVKYSSGANALSLYGGGVSSTETKVKTFEISRLGGVAFQLILAGGPGYWDFPPTGQLAVWENGRVNQTLNCTLK